MKAHLMVFRPAFTLALMLCGCVVDPKKQIGPEENMDADKWQPEYKMQGPKWSDGTSSREPRLTVIRDRDFRPLPPPEKNDEKKWWDFFKGRSVDDFDLGTSGFSGSTSGTIMTPKF